jgi:hypothetical protein
MLALMFERGMLERAHQVARSLGIDPATLPAASAAAFDWAQRSLEDPAG